uniref:Uncharacterized protein n=1 Tax=Lygus hesperus TaxID=30085 RepID=A0A146M6I4_LYGHE
MLAATTTTAVILACIAPTDSTSGIPVGILGTVVVAAFLLHLQSCQSLCLHPTHRDVFVGCCCCYRCVCALVAATSYAVAIPAVDPATISTVVVDGIAAFVGVLFATVVATAHAHSTSPLFPILVNFSILLHHPCLPSLVALVMVLHPLCCTLYPSSYSVGAPLSPSTPHSFVSSKSVCRVDCSLDPYLQSPHRFVRFVIVTTRRCARNSGIPAAIRCATTPHS